MLAGLQAPSGGDVAVDQVKLSDVHPEVAIAFQNPALLPWLTLERNVAFGLDFARQRKRSAQERQARVDAAIEEVGLTHARRLYPVELSGGMAQRAALARCLARRPKVLLLDEPFGALDEVTRAEMQTLLLRVVADYRTATVLITHDIDEALLVADRVLLLGDAPARRSGNGRSIYPNRVPIRSRHWARCASRFSRHCGPRSATNQPRTFAHVHPMRSVRRHLASRHAETRGPLYRRRRIAVPAHG